MDTDPGAIYINSRYSKLVSSEIFGFRIRRDFFPVESKLHDVSCIVQFECNFKFKSESLAWDKFQVTIIITQPLNLMLDVFLQLSHDCKYNVTYIV